MDRDQHSSGVFVMVAMTDYAEHPDLEVVREVVPRLCAVLRRAGFAQELAELDAGGTFSEVNSALGRWEPQDGAARLLYWAGHGYRDGTGHFLVVHDTPASRINSSTAMSAGALAGTLAGLPVGHTVLIVDTCFAGGSVSEVVRVLLTAFGLQTFPAASPSVTIVAACGPHDHLQDGRFSLRFCEVLERGSRGPAWSAGNKTVRLHDVVRAVREDCREHGDPEPDIMSKGWAELVFPNPRAIDLPPDDAETQRERQDRLLSRSHGDHFMHAARGIEVDETGWFFTGRTILLQTINAWLREPDDSGGMLIVTGSPGAGKSAVLGRIATLSDPVYRRLAEQEGALTAAVPGTIPDEGIIDVAIHAKNKSLREVQDALAAGLGLETHPAGWPSSNALIRAIFDRHQRVRIIVDALDEAARTAIVAIASDLLRPLAARSGFRIVVGTRAHLPGTAPEEAIPGHGTLIVQLDPERRNVHVLDEDPLTSESISRYVRRRLVETPHSPYIWQPLPETELNALVAAITDASGTIFLFARLVTRSLLNRHDPLLPEDADVRRLLTGEAKDVFRADLDRFERTDRVRVHDMLRALAWAEGKGFPRWPVWPAVASALSTTGANYGVHDVDWVLENAGYHVTESEEHGRAVYRLYHRAFAEFFREPGFPQEGTANTAEEREAQQAIARALLNTVPVRPAGDNSPEESRDWSAADPYILRHLSAHADAAGRLESIARDLGYLIHADPASLIEVLGVVSHQSRPQTRLYRRLAHELSETTPAQRAPILHLGAVRYEPRLAQHFPPFSAPITASWANMESSPFHRALSAHADEVTAVAFGTLPDGTGIIISGSRDRTVRIWDASTGILRTTLGFSAVLGSGISVAFGTLSNGHPAVVGTDGQAKIRIWHAATGLLLTTITDGDERVDALAFGVLPDGTPVIATGSFRTVRIWDADAGTIRTTITGNTGYVDTLAFGTLPDGTAIVVCNGGDGRVKIWDATTGILRAITKNDRSFYGIKSVACGILSDGCPIVVASNGNTSVWIWDAITGNLRTKLTNQDEYLPDTRGIDALAVGTLADGTDAIITGGTLPVSIWDPTNGTLRHAFTGDPSFVKAVALGTLPDGTSVIISGHSDKHVRIWETSTEPSTYVANPIASFIGRPSEAWRIPTVASGLLRDKTPIIASANGDLTVRIWDATTGALRTTIKGDCERVSTLSFGTLPDGVPVLIGGSYQTIVVWDAETGALRTTITAHSSQVKAVAFGVLSDGTPIIASAGRDERAVKIWDATTGALRTNTGEHIDTVNAVAFGRLSDGTSIIVSGGGHLDGEDRPGRIWDAATGEFRAIIPPAATRPVEKLAFNILPDDTAIIVSCDGYHEIHIWNVTTGGLRVIDTNPIRVNALAVGTLPDGRPIVAGGSAEGRVVCLWDATTGSTLYTLPVSAAVLDITVSDRHIAIGTASGIINFDLNSRRTKQ